MARLDLDGSDRASSERPGDGRTPCVVLVVGRPASGKSTVAKAIAERFGLPRVAKDDLKEILFDRLGAGDRAWSVRLGRAAFALLDHVVEQQLLAGSTFVVDAKDDPRLEDAAFQERQARTGCRVLQIHRRADEEELLRRFRARATSGERHPGHGDEHDVDELRAVLRDGRPEVLAVEGPVLELRADDPDGTERVLAAVGRLLGR